jgi:phage anti-repressor protein
MNKLIPITERVIGATRMPTVSARELHAFLAIPLPFEAWIADRITWYRQVMKEPFSEGKDFCAFLSESAEGGFRQDVALSLPMADRLAWPSDDPQRTVQAHCLSRYFRALEQAETAQRQVRQAYFQAIERAYTLGQWEVFFNPPAQPGNPPKDHPHEQETS